MSALANADAIAPAVASTNGVVIAKETTTLSTILIWLFAVPNHKIDLLMDPF
jgi:hypothetical protein